MTTSYPSSVDSFPRPSSSNNLGDSGFELDVVIDNLSDGVEAIETELGSDPSGAYSTVADRLAAGSKNATTRVLARATFR